MSLMRSGTLLSQFLRVFLSTHYYLDQYYSEELESDYYHRGHRDFSSHSPREEKESI